MAFWFAVPVGALSTAILIVNNLRDIHTDKKHNKITTAVLLGETGARLFYLSMVLLAYGAPLAAFAMGRADAPVLLALGTLPLAGFVLRNVWTKKGGELNAVLAQTSILLLATNLLMSIGIVL
jgi:1,4-dihydroxy-2-naphthoate octaprenyltransferase